MTSLSKLAQLRIIIAHLGEVNDPPWWGSSFTTEAGLDFSKYNFTKSYVSAAVNGAVVAARHLHDDRIGRRGTRHLFRFDGGLERTLHREILEADQNELAELIRDRETALLHLKEIARQTVDAPEGPVQIGKDGDEEREDAVVDLAAHYLSGFTGGKLVFPYFFGGRK